MYNCPSRRCRYLKRLIDVARPSTACRCRIESAYTHVFTSANINCTSRPKTCKVVCPFPFGLNLKLDWVKRVAFTAVFSPTEDTALQDTLCSILSRASIAPARRLYRPVSMIFPSCNTAHIRHHGQQSRNRLQKYYSQSNAFLRHCIRSGHMHAGGPAPIRTSQCALAHSRTAFPCSVVM